jgi:hypothetical protein
VVPLVTIEIHRLYQVISVFDDSNSQRINDVSNNIGGKGAQNVHRVSELSSSIRFVEDRGVETIYFLKNAAAPATTPIRRSVEGGAPVDVVIDTLVYYLRRVNRVRFAFTLFFPYRLTTWLTSTFHFNP